MEIVVEKIQRNQHHIKLSIVTDATYLFVQNITVNNICMIYNYIFLGGSLLVQHKMCIVQF